MNKTCSEYLEELRSTLIVGQTTGDEKEFAREKLLEYFYYIYETLSLEEEVKEIVEEVIEEEHPQTNLNSPEIPPRIAEKVKNAFEEEISD